MNKRKYTKSRRAEQQDETRNRIVEALVVLHQELGPANTSVKAIAEKAGVQRLTVYRHFPDEASMFQACSAHYMELYPLPNMADWAAIEDPVNRSYDALFAFYKYYQQTSAMWNSVYRDIDKLDALQGPMSQFESYIDQVCDDLVNSWRLKGNAKKHLQLTLRHALRFSTWLSLERSQLKDDKKAELVNAWLACISSGKG